MNINNNISTILINKINKYLNSKTLFNNISKAKMNYNKLTKIKRIVSKEFSKIITLYYNKIKNYN